MEPVRTEKVAKMEKVEGKAADEVEDGAEDVGWARAATASAPRVERPCRMTEECRAQLSNVPNVDR